MKLEFSRHLFENYSNIKFNENSFSEKRVISYGQMDERKDRRMERHKEANSPLSQFYERA